MKTGMKKGKRLSLEIWNDGEIVGIAFKENGKAVKHAKLPSVLALEIGTNIVERSLENIKCDIGNSKQSSNQAT